MLAPPLTSTTDAHTLDELRDAVCVMAREGVGAVAVVERAERNELQGIFTERDVMLRVVEQGRDPRATRVQEVMSSPVETASEETTASEALTLMLERHLRTRMSYLASMVRVTASYRSSIVLGEAAAATSRSRAGPGGGGYLRIRL